MKLYATTTSERASKGQGGQKTLETVFLGEIEGERRIMLRVHMRHDTVTGLITLRATNMIDDNVKDIIINEYSQLKGKQKKGEKCIHDWDNYGKCCNCGLWNTKL